MALHEQISMRGRSPFARFNLVEMSDQWSPGTHRIILTHSRIQEDRRSGYQFKLVCWNNFGEMVTTTLVFGETRRSVPIFLNRTMGYQRGVSYC